MMSKQTLDLIAFIDTRITDRPNWFLPGYDLVGFKKPITGNENFGRYGGIIVYKRRNNLNNITTKHKVHGHDTIWLEIEQDNNKPIMLSVSYARYYRSDKKERSRNFFNALDKWTNHFRKDCSELYSIGDFNARLGNLTYDRNTNAHNGHMRNYINKNGMTIANVYKKKRYTYVYKKKR